MHVLNTSNSQWKCRLFHVHWEKSVHKSVREHMTSFITDSVFMSVTRLLQSNVSLAGTGRTFGVIHCVCVYVCMCYQGKPHRDPPEFSLAVLKQLQEKRKKSWFKPNSERLKTAVLGSGNLHCVFVSYWADHQDKKTHNKIRAPYHPSREKGTEAQLLCCAWS